MNQLDPLPSMIENDQFWIEILRDYNVDQMLSLPYDRKHISVKSRSNQVWSTTFNFDLKLLRIFRQCTTKLKTTLENLIFTIYYIFLFKITNDDKDFWIGRNFTDKYDHRIPFYLRVDPHLTFIELLNRVTKMSTRTKQHAHVPLQIKSTLFPIVFNYHTVSCDTIEPSIFDLCLTAIYSEESNNLQCQINGSSDIFDHITLQKLSQRFHLLCQQLFISSFDLHTQPIYQLSIILPDEQRLLQQIHNIDTTISNDTSITIPQLFSQQAMKYPHKIAVTLDQASLTYSELFHRVKQLSFTLIDSYNVQSGDIICQCIERSIEMIIGILAIMMSGGIYVPLNPSDSSQRLDSLIQQIKPKLILTHHRSSSSSLSNKSDISSVSIDEIINRNNECEELPSVSITGESISNIIFTSGSTGIPKGVQIRHRNFVSYMKTQCFDDRDTILQLASCSFDVHLDEILCSLCLGGNLVLLRENGHLDLDYLTKVVADHHVTFIAPVPSWIDALCQYLRANTQANERMRSIRWWFIGGEQLLSSTIQQLLPFVDSECHLLNSYGPAEITEAATCYEICRDDLSEMITIPIGQPLKGYHIYLVDEYRQEVIPNQQGEIVIGGVGVFGGYYQREDLTEEVLVEMNGETCYKTGDYGRIDAKSGELMFVGRKDFQVKLRGQRIELGHIEHTIIKFSTFISNCIVIKYVYHEQEHLVAYVETPSNTIKEEDLHEKCLSNLSSYMIPSLFIILEKFPLSSNGKIERKSLPSPDFNLLSKTINEDIESMTPMEVRVHRLWCEVLDMKQISTKRPFFSLHGTSLLFMKLYSLYQIEFGIAPHIVTCLQKATISEHAQLLTLAINSSTGLHYQSWTCLHVDHAKVSFAQSRIFLDEQIRFQSWNEETIAIYNLPLLCRLSKSSLSIEDLRQTLRQITAKHAILRTCVRLDPKTGHLSQYIQPNDIQDWFSFEISIIDDNNELKTIFNHEVINRKLFDIAFGRVFRCHIVRQRSSIANATDLLSTDDWIIFNFHHIAFDGESERIFLDDFQQLYNHKHQKQDNDKLLQYIDYSIHEQYIDMTAAKMYWRRIFKDYEFKKTTILPVNRNFSSNSISTGEGLSIEIYLTDHIVERLITYASSANTTLYQVCLTIYYVFLYKLSGGRRDILIGIVQANRYRPELRHIIGMFVNTLPLLIHIDPYDTFEQVLSKVKTMIFESQPHSNLPYQSIIEQLPTKRLNQCNIIQTMFTLDEYQTTKSTSQLNRTFIIEPYSIHYLDKNLAQIGIPTNAPAMFDIELSMEYMTKTYSLRTNLSVSNELCDSPTLIKMARQFQLVVEQFSPSTSICDLSIILPEEVIQHEPKTITNSLTGNFNQVSFIYQITDGFLSLDRLRHAVQLVTLKHNLVEVDTVDVLCNPLHPNSSNGYQQKNNNTNLLEKGDTIVFKFHQSVLDILPMKIFYQELSQAYEYETAFINSNTAGYTFWDEIMFDYQWKRLFDLASEKHIGDTLTVSSTFNSDLTKAILTYVSTTNSSSMDLFLAIYYIFLFKLVFNQTDLCVGMPIDNLHKLDLLPLRLQLYPSENFECCLQRVTKLCQKSLYYAHHIHRDVKFSSSTYLDIVFNFKNNSDENETINKIRFPTAQLQQIRYVSDTNQLYHHSDPIPSNFDLCLTVIHNKTMNTFQYQFEGSSDIFDHITLQKLSQRFHLLCQQLFISSFDLHAQPIYQLSIILPDEQRLLQQIHNIDTTISNDTSITIPQLFSQQAMKYPHKIAVTLDQASLTYSELFHRVKQLSFTLIDSYNVQSGDIICQCIERSIEMIIGILAIMMSGGIYVPLNPSDSSQRLDSLIQQIKPKLILTHHRSSSSSLSNKSDISSVSIDEIINRNNECEELPSVSITGESISNIIFTSGSTGIPKGVQIRHRNFISFIKTHSYDDRDTILQLASCSFDVHLDEILCSLCLGGNLVLLRENGHLDLDYLTKVVADHHVTFITPVPSMIDALCQYLRANTQANERMRSIRWWFIGGEQLFSPTVQQLLPFIGPECHLLNSYGPAEVTEASTIYEICRDDLNEMITIPIGQPLKGYHIYLVDEYRQEVIPNQQGEIVIGGVGVFGGYYQREDLTEEVLVEMNGETCYKTGDYGRIDAKSGELMFVGRKDFQVKLRGQRIELSMIESVILQSSSEILNCIVIKEDSSNNSYLCAYVKTRENADTKRIGDELMRMCHNQLPSYMIPSKWMCITEFPLNSNGKVDRQKLSNLSQIVNLPSVYQPIVAPLSSLEKKLEDIFVRAFTLKTSPDILKSFGQLGGTSLGAMHALILIRQEIYEQMDISLLFANPSIRQLASVLEPLLANVKSIEVENEDEKNFSIRPRSSWLIETLGIILLAWQWLWPFYFTSQSNIYMFRLLFIPLIHLFQYLLFVKLLDASSLHGRDSLYSWRYYRLWFLRRQWSLNTYWLGYLFGTRFYNSYLRFCGARISKTACIYTSQIDAPWLIEIGDCSYIGEEVVLSSMSYHDCIYELHQIRIGSHCSIETRSVLHDRVDMHDGIFIAPLTSVTGQILGNDGGDIHLSSETAILKHSIFQLLMILLMISLHALIFEISWYAISCISICWFIWSIVGAIMSLFFLRFVVGHVEEKFSHPLSSWSFLRRFWLRHLVLHSFHPCLSTSFDGFNSFTPFILRWLGATIENNHIEIADFVPLLSIPSNLLTIKSDVTTTSEICFVPYDTTIDGLCIVTGPIEINRRVFLGNNCLLQSGVSIPEDVLIGSLTRIDSTTMILPGDILLGVPAQSMPFILSDVDETRKISNDFPRIVIECIHFILLDLCLSFTVMNTTNFNQFLLMVLICWLIYSFLLYIIYMYYMNNNTSESNWKITLAMIFYSQYTKYIGRFLGSTQWLIFILRQFGAQIGNDVIIDEMNSLYDVHLITIDDHARLSSTCQIQCHTFEHRQLKLRSVKIGSHCILKDMSFVLPGVEFLGYNYLHPCSLALPHDQFKLHTDWSGSPTKRLIVHYGIQPPRFILANRQSSIDNYVVVVARTDDDILILYFGENGWTSWQSGLNLRQPCRPSYIYIRLFFTSFLCNSKPKRILIVGLGGGIWPMLIRHYFPTVIIDVVEIDQTVIDLANEFFGLEEEQTKNNYLNLITDDGYHYVKKTAHRYDMIFIDAFLEDTIPAQINSQQFVLNLHRILNNNGCLITNVNVPSTIDFDRIVQRLTSVFESNILLAHTNTIENARVIISGNQSSLTSISSRTETIQQAERFEIETHLEFSFSHLISLAYHGLINKKIIET